MNISGGIPMTVTFDSRAELQEFYLNTGIVGGLPLVREIREAIDATTLNPPGQGELFDEIIVKDTQPAFNFPTNLVEWALGQEAGYRGDELVGEKSQDFMLGYHQGQVSKAAHLATHGEPGN